MVAADSSQGEKCPAEAGHKCSVEMGCISRPLNLSIGTIRATSALNLSVLPDDVPIAAVEITDDGLALRFEPKSGSALLVRADAIVGDETALSTSSPQILLSTRGA
jgi:hypothetical protein